MCDGRPIHEQRSRSYFVTSALDCRRFSVNDELFNSSRLAFALGLDAFLFDSVGSPGIETQRVSVCPVLDRAALQATADALVPELFILPPLKVAAALTEPTDSESCSIDHKTTFNTGGGRGVLLASRSWA